MYSLLLNSSGSKLSKKQQTWLTNAYRLMLSNQYSFSANVQGVLKNYLGMLAETKTLIPLATLHVQLGVLNEFKEDDQLNIVSYTIYRGWKSLCYAIDRQTKRNSESSKATAKFKEV